MRAVIFANGELDAPQAARSAALGADMVLAANGGTRHALACGVMPHVVIGDLDSPHGDNNQNLAPPSGFPAITVPMGWVRDGTLPTGLQFLGVAWSEGKLFGLAYAWEQATRHRRPPASTPPLGRD